MGNHGDIPHAHTLRGYKNSVCTRSLAGWQPDALQWPGAWCTQYNYYTLVRLVHTRSTSSPSVSLRLETRDWSWVSCYTEEGGREGGREGEGHTWTNRSLLLSLLVLYTIATYCREQVIWLAHLIMWRGDGILHLWQLVLQITCH